MKYRLIRELFGEEGAREPSRVFTDIVETDNPDEVVRPFCLGRGARCDISEYADSRRKYEINASGIKQIITLNPYEELIVPEQTYGGINCL